VECLTRRHAHCTWASKDLLKRWRQPCLFVAFPSLRGSSRQAAAVGGWGLGAAGGGLGKKHGKLAEEEEEEEEEVAECGLARGSPCKKLKKEQTDRQTDRQTDEADRP